jgi:hypothetical protein
MQGRGGRTSAPVNGTGNFAPVVILGSGDRDRGDTGINGNNIERGLRGKIHRNDSGVPENTFPFDGDIGTIWATNFYSFDVIILHGSSRHSIGYNSMPNWAGTRLPAFDGGSQLASSSINIRYGDVTPVPLPATLPLLAAALGGRRDS